RDGRNRSVREPRGPVRHQKSSRSLQRTRPGRRARHYQIWRDSCFGLTNYVGNPERLTVNLDAFQSIFRQVFLFQAEEREMWQITQDGLKPTMFRQNLAHARIEKF